MPNPGPDRPASTEVECGGCIGQVEVKGPEPGHV